jgi:hypothetical protein
VDEESARRRDLYRTRQHSKETDIHPLGGIRTLKRSTADPRLRPFGQVASYHLEVRNITFKSTVLPPQAEVYGITWNMLASIGLRLRQQCKIFNFCVTKTVFEEGFVKTKDIAITAESYVSFKKFCLEKPCSAVRGKKFTILRLYVNFFQELSQSKFCSVLYFPRIWYFVVRLTYVFERCDS